MIKKTSALQPARWKNSTVNLKKLEACNNSVIQELYDLGFYDDRTAQTEVYLTMASYAFGYQYYGGDGSICIPRISVSVLIDRLNGVVTSLKDVLRHEYAHAVADTHRGLMRSRRFSEVFGGPHGWDGEQDYDSKSHVTAYAASATGEDFAEVFYLFLKHQGRLPKRLNTPAISAKWQFLEELRQAIEAGKRRW